MAHHEVPIQRKIPHRPAHFYWRATALFTQPLTGRTVMRIKDVPNGPDAASIIDAWHAEQELEAGEFNAQFPHRALKFSRNCFEIWS